jgi:hypothetical protein
LLINSAGPEPAAQLVDQVNIYLKDSQEYSRFFRSVIGSHRDKHWVEDLIQTGMVAD